MTSRWNYDRQDERRELHQHVFMVSAGLVGVCLTVLGITKAVVRLKAIRNFSQDLLAVDALLFLVACLSAYLSLRLVGKWATWAGRISDGVFLLGLSVMTVVCALIAWVTV